MATGTSVQANISKMDAVKTFDDIATQKKKIDTTFPGYVKTAEAAVKALQEGVAKYQTPAADLKIDASILTKEKTVFEKSIATMKGHAEAIDVLAKSIKDALAKSGDVSLYSAKTTANLGKIDDKLQAFVMTAFTTVIENNKQLLQWQAALTKLQAQMTAHITLGEKWMPTFTGIVTAGGKPLTSMQYYGVTALPTENK